MTFNGLFLIVRPNLDIKFSGITLPGCFEGFQLYVVSRFFLKQGILFGNEHNDGHKRV